MNIPNIITLGRVILVPIVFWLLVSGQTQAAFFAFVLAGLSDAVDGFIAKRFGLSTELGAYLDPLADKLLIVSIFVALGVRGALPSWLVIAVVSRDILIVTAVVLSWVLGNPVRISPLAVSKANTVAQIVLAGTVLAVRLDNPDDSSRWYPGSGLYRNVWLVKTAPVHVAQWGTYITTPLVSADEAVVKVNVRVQNHTSDQVAVALTTAIHELDAGDAIGAKPVASADRIEFEMDPKRDTEAMRTHLLRVRSPRLWDLETPHRYVAITTVEQGGKVVDRVETRFGIRTIRYDASYFTSLDRIVQSEPWIERTTSGIGHIAATMAISQNEPRQSLKNIKT